MIRWQRFAQLCCSGLTTCTAPQEAATAPPAQRRAQQQQLEAAHVGAGRATVPSLISSAGRAPDSSELRRRGLRARHVMPSSCVKEARKGLANTRSSLAAHKSKAGMKQEGVEQQQLANTHSSLAAHKAR